MNQIMVIQVVMVKSIIKRYLSGFQWAIIWE